MITFETTYYYHDSIRAIRELPHEATRLASRFAARLMDLPGAGMRPVNHDPGRSAPQPRWTREVENPFDIPVRACRHAIR